MSEASSRAVWLPRILVAFGTAAFALLAGAVAVDGVAVPFKAAPMHMTQVTDSVGLTFDDGPHPAVTPAILDILAEHDAHATFFVLGKQAERNPEIIERIVAEGHEIAIHGYEHTDLGEAGYMVAHAQISGCSKLLKDRHGLTPVWYRAPWGKLTIAQMVCARLHGMQAASWVYCIDGEGVSCLQDRVLEVSAEVVPGQILLGHDGGESRKPTVEALPTLLAVLEARGLTCVTLSELAAVK